VTGVDAQLGTASPKHVTPPRRRKEEMQPPIQGLQDGSDSGLAGAAPLPAEGAKADDVLGPSISQAPPMNQAQPAGPGPASAASAASAASGASGAPAAAPSTRGGVGVVGHQSYWAAIPRQIVALLKKNFILAGRNRTATFLRVFASFFFVLIIFLVNEGVKSRYATDSFFKDTTEPEAKPIPGIPACKVKSGKPTCYTFSYAPAPYDEFVPDTDYATFDDYKAGILKDDKSICTKGAGFDAATSSVTEVDITCVAADCDTEGGACATCCAGWRTHKVVRGIMALNGTKDGTFAIPNDRVIGFLNGSQMDAYLLENSETVQGGYIFNSVSDKKTTFIVQHNSTSAAIRGDYENIYRILTLPLQVQAQASILRKLIAKDDNIPVDIDLQEFAHPAFEVATFEGVIAPLLIVGYAMFPFVIQMGEVVTDKELKFRQAIGAMGLHDLSYWLSWHIYQTAMAFVSAFFLYAFGCIFQFSLFLKNDFGVLFLTFWLFMQAMVGLGFLVGSFLRRSASAVTIGFGFCLLGFILFFMIGLFGFPYGSYNGTIPFSYKTDITSGNLTISNSTGDRAVEPVLAMLPPCLFIKNINDLGALSAAETQDGIRFSEAYSYCKLENTCNPTYSIGACWGVFLIEYLLYSVLGLYIDNVLPDAMGVRKPPWYWLLPAYWGFGNAVVKESLDSIEASTDEDVLDEEKVVQSRINSEMAPNSAIEIRGLKQQFSRGGKPFFAVKCPWYAVDKRQLFALLGPNGAGKSTTINMLTGWLPPTSGNAMVLGNTIADPSGMARVRSMMGVCPQFDILWDNLSAKQHLELFGAIKGINPKNISSEADRRIEEVRLTESANQRAGAFSGGMKRRLSVAVALIGDPDVVYLDEPTTGMDPINRRHVWDVIEAAKQDRCVVLTTHSMEEADILGDRIGIMAKGRLRCLGNSVRLKSRFGAGYKVSVSVGSHIRPDDPKAVAVKQLFEEKLEAVLSEETKAYMHFNIPSKITSDETTMAAFFQDLDARRGELGVVDVQLQMSTLEDVFLRIAQDCEVEEARANNKLTNVTLHNGEQVSVLLGSEEPLTSPQGVTFTVKWGTDENGSLIALDTKEVEMEDVNVLVTAPADATPGQIVAVQVKGKDFQVAVPDGVAPGAQFNVSVKVQKKAGATAMASTTTEEQGVKFTAEEIDRRVAGLKTPFSGQSNALFRKNLTFQSKRICTNCCLILLPVFFLIIIFLIQLLIELLFLSQPVVRCPYCGPEDDFSKSYCNGKNCTDYFFPEADADALNAKYGVNVRAECEKTKTTCIGNGNTTCFESRFAPGSPFCPFPIGPVLPALGASPSLEKQGGFLSETPVLYTGKDAYADEVASRMFATTDSEVDAKMKGVAGAMFTYMWTMLSSIPFLGCSDASFNSFMNQQQEESVCRLMQHGMNTSDLCCVDVSDSNSTRSSNIFLAPAGGFFGTFRQGLNIWSDNPLHDTDAEYDAFMLTCKNTSMTTGNTTTYFQSPAKQGSCNQQWYFQVVAGGGKVAQGFGKTLVKGIVASLGQPDIFTNLLNGFLDQEVNGDNIERFQCVRPRYHPDVATKMADTDPKKCHNLEEGMNIIAKYTAMPQSVHPNPEPDVDIPECTAAGTCKFENAPDGPVGETAPGTTYTDFGGRWAQSCDYYTKGMLDDIRAISEGSDFLTKITAYVEKVPCYCRFQVAANEIIKTLAMPTGALAAFALRLPTMYNCPKAAGSPDGPNAVYNCMPTGLPYVMHPFSIPNMVWTTPVYGGRMGFNYAEAAITEAGFRLWWSKDHVLDSKKEQDESFEEMAADKDCFAEGDCWERVANGRGTLNYLAQDCGAMWPTACWLQRVGNLTDLDINCVPAKPKKEDSVAAMNKRTYDGHFNKFGGGGGATKMEEYLLALDLRDTSASKVNFAIGYNDTTVISSGVGAQGPPPAMLRVQRPLSAIMDAYIRHKMGAGPEEYTSAMLGLKEMPKIGDKLSLDIGGSLGPFFFTIAMFLLFPAVVTAMVYEKEMKLRVMMRMMGLGTSAYWLINYLFWLLIYSVFTFLFVLIGSTASLPSGYTIGIFTRTDPSVHVVFFLFFINNTIAFAFLIATLIRFSRTASISATLFVIIMSLIANLAWDSGNFFNSASVSDDFKNFITLFPVWNFYRGWNEYREYAGIAARFGIPGMSWSDMANDPRNGFGAVLTALALEWPFFLILALYLDQIIDSGSGVPKHPLFFLGFKHKAHENTADVEADGGIADLQDVKKEEERVHTLRQSGQREDAVTIDAIGKTFPAYMGNPPKTAVKTLTMGVGHGECFGMLGPNGAGKTTTINMLVGFLPPTSGTARVEGFDITTDMDRIYTLMGVCPQHDILWETLTARQHMLFYGRLKNLKGEELKQAVVSGLKQVNLLNVIDERAGTFSGGMKRRLSVAVSMIGNPLCAYLDEPSTGLDPASRRTLWDCIKEAKKQSAIFLTTHSMEEAEGLCDRLGIFVDGALRCIGNPKELTSRFGGFYILTITSDHGMEEKIHDMVHKMAKNVRDTYKLSGTQKFEIPIEEVTLSGVFEQMRKVKDDLRIKDWGISNTTLEEAFIKISRGAIGT